MIQPHIIPSDMLVEEEELPDYVAKDYYPANIGQTFNDRYKIVGKLGFGGSSTVWLCRDLTSDNKYVTLKIYINRAGTQRELPVCKHISNLAASRHAGREHVRMLLDSFEVQGPDGRHLCLVWQPLGNSVDELVDLSEDGLLNAEVTRDIMRPILTALQFLHEEAKIIHTGESQQHECHQLTE